MMLQSHPAGVVLSDLFFSGNRAVGIGGGVSNLDHAVTFSDSVFVGNTSSAGGGIADNSNGSLTCLNSTITGNRGTTQGDGIYWQNAAPSLLNTIVWGNPSRFSATNEDLSPTTGYSTSHSDVGGYTGSDATTFSADPSFVSAPRFFDRTTVAASGTGSVIVASGVPYALNDILEIGEDGVGRGVISVVGSTVSFSPPLASAAAAGVQVRDWGAALGTLDLHLATGSVCINAGDATVAPPTDITGQARVGVPDIGAYEHP
jgi:hypothetical protein